MAHIFFGIAASDFLVDRQGRRQRSLFGVRAGMDVVHRAAGGQLGGRGNWRTGFQHLNDARAPFRSRGLIFDVGIDAIEQAFRAELGQLAVEIFARLAEEFIRSIAEAKDSERGPVQLRRFFREQELMQCDRFFRRLTFPLGGRHDHQQFFRSNLFEFIIACIHQLHVQLRCQQIVAQRFGDAAGIAGLRGGNQRDRGHLSGLGRNGHSRAGLLIQHAPEIARHPGKLSGREVSGGRLKARQLLRVERQQVGRCGLCRHASFVPVSKAVVRALSARQKQKRIEG